MQQPSDQTTIAFPTVDDRRSSTPTVRGILVDATRDVDPNLAADIETAPQWRSDYVPLIGRVTAASAESPKAALALAENGVASMRARMVAATPDGDVPLAGWVPEDTAAGFATEVVHGTSVPERELTVPYGGATLRGEALREQLHRWEDAGVVERSFVTAIESVIDHPEWLAVPGRTVVLLGAAAEMSPFGSLTSWGADVLAVDVPSPQIWDRIRTLAESGAGTTSYPVAPDGTPGADLVTRTGDVVRWLRDTAAHDVVVGMYAYADGGAHVRVTAAADVIAERMTASGRNTAIAYLATPTDAFVVPGNVVEASQRAYGERGAVRLLQAPLRAVSRGRLFVPNYATVLPDGTGVADILVPQQGPNYAMAKRLQRWRGVVAEDAGQRVSFNVAPATWTRSVTKNRVLAAAYGGAKYFGVEIFQPATTRALMAALLVHDLHRTPPTRDNPEELFAENAAHGGLWRVGYEPRSALGVAALGGLPALMRSR
ncbi:hypothetical protein FE697_018660 [Mumia zhuanghuii]|uniref:Uncharacterized protein n=2 Tax=Mumia TaxID=1546255 RepID=A0ABW1QJI3_9ACTN|nr:MULTISPECIES: hypothetical protein [Mumia]KAA1419919.1 hypothetical protein FE697_018660 [Mumia zhuanghuii]